MWKQALSTLVALAVLAASAALAAAAGAQPAPANTEGWTAILDNSSVWRVLRTDKFLVMKRGDTLEELPEYFTGLGENYSDRKQIVTIFPQEGWAEPEFDDSDWQQRHFFATGDEKEMAGETGRNWLQTNLFHHLRGGPNQRQVTLRGKFLVTDPAAVKRLSLNMVFRGGVVVYLNGKEVTRAFLPAGKLEAGALAEIYPEAAYVKPDGHYWQPWWDGEASKLPPEQRIQKACYPLRLRKLTGVEVPASLLRQGVNVLGVEIHAAPYLPGKANVYGFGEIPEPKEKRLYGWKSKGADGQPRGVLAWYPRETYDGSPLTKIFPGVEASILSGRRGLGQIGADL